MFLGLHLSLVERRAGASKEPTKAEGLTLWQRLISEVPQGLLLIAPQDVLDDPGKLRSRCRSGLKNSLSSLLKSKILWR